jgi:hypothetical protein
MAIQLVSCSGSGASCPPCGTPSGCCLYSADLFWSTSPVLALSTDSPDEVIVTDVNRQETRTLTKATGLVPVVGDNVPLGSVYAYSDGNTDITQSWYIFNYDNQPYWFGNEGVNGGYYDTQCLSVDRSGNSGWKMTDNFPDTLTITYSGYPSSPVYGSITVTRLNVCQWRGSGTINLPDPYGTQNVTLFLEWASPISTVTYDQVVWQIVVDGDTSQLSPLVSYKLTSKSWAGADLSTPLGTFSSTTAFGVNVTA